MHALYHIFGVHYPCALSEEAPEKVHLRQYVSLLSYCSPEARLDIQHMKTVKQLYATDMTKTTKLTM